MCQRHDNVGACICIEDYLGNPYEGCQPECILSSDCPTNEACIRNKCQNPCLGICGTDALCSVVNHIPTCTCLPGYVGDPFKTCTQQTESINDSISISIFSFSCNKTSLKECFVIISVPPEVTPCVPSPCGPNSICRAINNQAVCSCEASYVGLPPNCRPECVVNSECSQTRACYKYKCTDPCPGTCGLGAQCKVINHNPLCSCPLKMTGDPFIRCYPEIREQIFFQLLFIRPEIVYSRNLYIFYIGQTPNLYNISRNPCVPNPCGVYSKCKEIGDQPVCFCLPNYIGSPPNCRPECSVNTDCPSNHACISEKCRDPCIGSCGQNADCRVQNHIPTCLCQQDYTGDPFSLCSPIIKGKNVTLIGALFHFFLIFFIYKQYGFYIYRTTPES